MLAIIIPFYKLSFFEETIQSLASQTDQRFRVYIGDDASPEDCTFLLEQFTGKFDFKYYRFENNLGGIFLSEQWERCIALSADEEWMMILGDDDVLGENVVEEFYRNLPKFRKGNNLVRFATRVHYVKHKIFSDVYSHPELEFYKETYLKKLKGTSRSSLSEYVFTRSIFNKYKFKKYPLAWNSDDRAWFDFSEDKPIFSINEAIITIKISENSISGYNKNQELKDKSHSEFYIFLLFGKRLNFYERIMIGRLYLKLPKSNVNFFVKFYIRILIKIYSYLKRLRN